MKKIKLLILFFAILPFSNCVMANQDGDGSGGDGTKNPSPVLSGSVSDAFSKKPIMGVTISVTSSKDRIEKLVTTDASGKFIIPKLPAGEVTIILEKKGYKTYRREKIVVKEGMQVKMNFDISNDQEAEHNNNLFHPLLRMIES